MHARERTIKCGSHLWQEELNVDIDMAAIVLPDFLKVVCVLHGFDPYYNYSKIRKAVNYLAKDSVQFIATNKDMRAPSVGNLLSPGTCI